MKEMLIKRRVLVMVATVTLFLLVSGYMAPTWFEGLLFGISILVIAVVFVGPLLSDPLDDD